MITFWHGQHLETSPKRDSESTETGEGLWRVHISRIKGNRGDGCKNKLSAGTLDGRRLLWRERWNFLSSRFGKPPGSAHLRHRHSKYANAFQILISCYRRLLIGDIFSGEHCVEGSFAFHGRKWNFLMGLYGEDICIINKTHCRVNREGFGGHSFPLSYSNIDIGKEWSWLANSHWLVRGRWSQKCQPLKV